MGEILCLIKESTLAIDQCSYNHFYYSPTAPADYIGLDMNIPLSVGVGLPGQMRFCDNIIINDDNFAEGNEDFFVNLASLNSLVSINPLTSSATVEIVDDDSKCRST